MCHKRGVSKISGRRECLDSSEGVKEREKMGRGKETEPKTEPWKMLIEGGTVSNAADDEKAPKDF